MLYFGIVVLGMFLSGKNIEIFEKSTNIGNDFHLFSQFHDSNLFDTLIQFI